jgi:NAD-dependent deacetylase
MIVGSAASARAESSLHQAARLISTSRYTVALTGAGISTPSGLPDFRSPGKGLWERYDPTAAASLEAFRHDPQIFYNWVRTMMGEWIAAEPNPAHLALAQLESLGRLQALVTQNIDALHERAGSRHVISLHGTMDTASCGSCYAQTGSQRVLEALHEPGAIPRCERCGGVLKPDVILFGEQLPRAPLEAAIREFRRAELILVAGSSLEVVPAATLPLEGLNRGAHLVIVNRLPTYLDERADVVLHEDVALALPALVQRATHDNC